MDQAPTPAHPSRKRLVLTWLILVALTLLSMVSGNAVTFGDSIKPLGSLAIGILMLGTLFKCRQLLFDFLNLRHSTREWQFGFLMSIATICAAVTGSYLLAL